MKKMKIKLLDYTLMGLLAGVVPAALAQQQSGDSEALYCGAQGCGSEEGLLFQARTRSLKTVPDSTSATPGRAGTQGKYSLTLGNGGVIWATEDPTLGQAELSVSAPAMVAFDGQAITTPVQFYLRSNYAAFVERHELTIYRAEDADLITPLAQIPMRAGAVAETRWDGQLPAGQSLRVGDELIYVVRAYDARGNFDEIYPQRLQLVSPEEAQHGSNALRNSTEKSLGTALSAEQAQTQSLINQVFSGNGLRQQNIPLHGSRVRVQGRNLPESQSLRINGESYPVDLERKFVAEYLMPIGQHTFDVVVGDAPPRTLEVDVSGRYFFAVGLADVTIAQNKHTGSSAAFANDVRYADDVISDGRLAFYGKAKYKGRYLVTAQADTTERDLERLFDGFTRPDPQDIFLRLDPDLYYPTYGDDSTTYRDVDTMGRFYVRVDWDKNQALWGNFNTGFTGTEFAQYVRSLYGAALDWRANATNRWGDPGTELRVFASEAQTAPGRSEFIGTGGSVYSLRHTDILPGSEQVVLEIRDLTTGRVQHRATLQQGADYEIDALQGRLILSRALLQLTREHLPTLTRDTPLDGLEQRLVVDYEWVPSNFNADEMTAGVRAKHWFGNHVGLGATYVDENRAGEDYRVMGVDLTLQAGKGTYFKVEHTKTEATAAPVHFSDNGGFTFTQLNPVSGEREGTATAIEARANFKELGWTTQEWSAGTWWRDVEAGYSTGRFDNGQDIAEIGVEVLGRLSPRLGLYTRFTKAERDAESLTQAQFTGEWRINDNATLSGELRRIEEDRAGGNAAGTLGAFKYHHRFDTALEVYGIAQLTLDDDGGQYADNDAFTVGGKYLFGNLSSIGAEATTGDRGQAVTLNAEYRLDANHSFYGGYTHATDQGEYDALFNPVRRGGWTLGQRWRLSSQVNLYNESQYLKAPHESGLAHIFGMDFYPAMGWTLGFTLQDGELTNQEGGIVDRRAISVSGGRTSADTDWQTKLEWRKDTGVEQREQWVSTNRLSHKLDESWRIAARFNYADTRDELNAAAGAKFIEGNLGFAYRPWDNTRWGLFGRYTHLYDLSTLGQVGGAQYDQKSQILSLEGVYKYSDRWEFAAKAAQREGEVRFGRNTGTWADASTTFAAGQIRYDLRQQWHGLAEYRWLKVKDGGTRQGWLVGVDRDINKHFRVGVGYNFTDFSDDLTNFDYDHKGWFLNLVGNY